MDRKWVRHPLHLLFIDFIGTMLNLNSGNNGQGLKTLSVNRPLDVLSRVSFCFILLQLFFSLTVSILFSVF